MIILAIVRLKLACMLDNALFALVFGYTGYTFGLTVIGWYIII